MNKQIRFMIVFLMGLEIVLLPVQALDFHSSQKITPAGQPFHLSRNANGSMAFDGNGDLHLVFWSGGLGTSPNTPSYIFYQSWSISGGWGPVQTIDESTIGADHVGGRHPALAITPDNTVWVVWQDHRHCTADGNWINNTEVYADFKPAGGTFTIGDIRLTNTVAAHDGDNAYMPKIAAMPDGRLVVAWSDFNANRGLSDLYRKVSLPMGGFDLTESIAAMRLTFLDQRGGAPGYSLPDLAVEPDGTCHLVWCGGYGSDVNLYYGRSGITSSTTTETLLAAEATDFFDPAHIIVVPNGDVWIAYGDDSAPNGENLVIRRKRQASSSFDDPIVLIDNMARTYAPDLEMGPDGLLHLVWVDQRNGTQIQYGCVDPESGILVEEKPLTTISANWTRPTLAWSKDHRLAVVWEETVSSNESNLWFTFTDTLTLVENWLDY